jgi:uncharacterized membrane protein
MRIESGLAHAALYGGLLALFGRSLLPGRADLVTAIARAVHVRRGQALPAAMARYTRRVTQAWCGFFAGQLAASALLLAFAPAGIWSLIVNVLDLPLVLAMFAAEYAVRLMRFRGHEHPSLAETIRAAGAVTLPSLRGRGDEIAPSPACGRGLG